MCVSTSTLGARFRCQKRAFALAQSGLGFVLKSADQILRVVEGILSNDINNKQVMKNTLFNPIRMDASRLPDVQAWQ